MSDYHFSTPSQTRHKILLCTDYSEDAEVAFVHAFDQALKYNSDLHIMNVIPSINPCGIAFDDSMPKKEGLAFTKETDERRRLQELGALKKVYYRRCRELESFQFVVLIGSPDIEIINYAEKQNITMIFLGTSGHTEKNRRVFIRTAANVSKFSNSQVITIGSPKK